MKNNEDIELMIFRLKEGLLSGEERRNAEHYLRQHPEWQEAAGLYDPLLKVPSYPAATFPGKESLRKPVPPSAAQRKNKTLTLRRLSIAATILLVVSVAASVLLLHETGDEATHTVAESQQNILPTLNAVEHGSRPNDAPQQAIRTVPPAPRAAHSTENAVAADLPPQSEATPTATVTLTDKLIVYLDEITTQEADIPIVNSIDKLIAYLPDDTTDSTPADKTSRPLWTYTVEDWWNGIQLAYTELQYETINKSNNKNQ